MEKRLHKARSVRRLTQCLLLAVLALPVMADPCGMVPPIQLSGGAPELMRVGDQLTYVFFKDGVEDIALRPGFKGKLTDFGMLIPFPSPPDIARLRITTEIQRFKLPHTPKSSNTAVSLLIALITPINSA